ncbi:MAG TPA: alpha/beta fold hydrolase [Hyphomicrobiaceae bacterium]|nr:alpha/beta fold hydrolase [Hyphomicrobiaceae bacterium]
MRSKEKIHGHQGSYQIPGGRSGVLLVHSLGGTPVELRYLAQAFAREGYTVNCPFIPGMTGGTDVSGISSYEDWYAGLERAYEEMAETCDTIYVGGLSAGAMLALCLAAKRPERIGGVMLFAPTLWPNGWAIPWYFNFFRLVRERFTARLFHFRQRAPYGIKDERIRKFVIESFTADDRPVEDLFGRGGGLVYQFRRLVSHVKRTLGTIDKPAFIMHPRFDDQSDLSNTFKLQRSLGGMVETVVLDDCYHMVTLDRQRHVVVDRAVDFVDRLTAAEQARVVRPLAERQVAGSGAAE